MPQIEQLQLVHWGCLRPDPIELDPSGINVATGGNGTGKTCLLDGTKLILGVEQLKQRPAEYIFDGRGDPDRRAERAYIKAIFRNPIISSRHGRLFADAGRGCEHTDHVTAICEINRDGRRRYTIHAGATTWGDGGRRLEDELQALNTLPRTHWLRPRQWSNLLARAGVPRALLGVLSVKQGETDRAIEGTPEDLLKRMLELTGKQQTLEAFREARTKLAKAQKEYLDAQDRLHSERRELERLYAQVMRHEDYLRTNARYRAIIEHELPTAKHRQRERDLKQQRSKRDEHAVQLRQAIDEVNALERALPALDQRLDELEITVNRLTREAAQAPAELERLAGEDREASLALGQAQRSIKAAREIVEPLDDDALARFERHAATAGQALMEAEREDERLLADIEQLIIGKTPRPAGLEEFRALLEAHNITTTLLADELEVADEVAVAAEAVLDRGVWTLVVPADGYKTAVKLAREHGYRFPIARAGDGMPQGILSAAHGADGAGAYLEEIDLPASSNGETGVANDGLVRGRQWAQFRAPEQPALGEHARQEALARALNRLEELKYVLPDQRQASTQARNNATAVAAGLAALPQVDALTSARQRAANALAVQRKHAKAVADELATSGPELGRLREEVQAKRAAQMKAERRRLELKPHLDTQNTHIRALEEELARYPLTPEQTTLGELPSIETLEHELQHSLKPRLAEFTDEERSELAPIQRDDQQVAVSRAQEYLDGRDETVKQAVEELDRAHIRYDEHVRQTMQALNRSFKQVCMQAGMDGEITLQPSPSIEDEWSLDVRVAHTPGEPKRPYQSREHSGGQRAKISILLLLAAMSIEGSADLLIMDEHIAHLDSQNIDYVAEVMAALKGKVQFLLATPTNAEAARLTWCDHQLAFLPRPKGQPYSPPIRLFTRMSEPERSGDSTQRLNIIDATT